MLKTCPLCAHRFVVRYQKQRICPRCLGAKKTKKRIKQELQGAVEQGYELREQDKKLLEN